jgi:DNA-binding IscR family transcriptional regulator
MAIFDFFKKKNKSSDSTDAQTNASVGRAESTIDVTSFTPPPGVGSSGSSGGSNNDLASMLRTVASDSSSDDIASIVRSAAPPQSKQSEVEQVAQLASYLYDNKKITINDVTMQDILILCRIVAPKEEKYTDECFEKLHKSYEEFFKRVTTHAETRPSIIVPTAFVVDRFYKEEVKLLQKGTATDYIKTIETICSVIDGSDILCQNLKSSYMRCIELMRNAFCKIGADVIIIDSVLRKVKENMSKSYDKFKFSDMYYIESRLNRMAAKYNHEIEEARKSHIDFKMHHDSAFNIATMAAESKGLIKPEPLGTVLQGLSEMEPRLVIMNDILHDFKRVVEASVFFKHVIETMLVVQVGKLLPFTIDDIRPPFTKKQEEEIIRNYVANVQSQYQARLKGTNIEDMTNLVMSYNL